MGTNGMSARVFKRKTTKINMAARLLSRFVFHLLLSLLSRTTVHQKMARHVLKNTLLSTPPDVAKLTFRLVLCDKHLLREKLFMHM